jgi:hypothetical protein
MKRNLLTWPVVRIWVALAFAALSMLACASKHPPGLGPAIPTVLPVVGTPQDVAALQTLQAVAAQTAESIETSMPTPSPTPPPATTPAALGTPLAALTGPCLVPDGFVVLVRQDFCLAAPPDWTPNNVDGGVAASLNTTPGQSIALQPPWADSAAVCSLMIYTSVGGVSTQRTLEQQYTQFRQRVDLAEISPGVATMAVGNLAVPGFTWKASDGTSGGVYVGTIASNREAHISYSGTQCALEQVLPVLQTLRFNIVQ